MASRGFLFFKIFRLGYSRRLPLSVLPAADLLLALIFSDGITAVDGLVVRRKVHSTRSVRSHYFV